MILSNILFFAFLVFFTLLILTVLAHMAFLVPYVPSKMRVVEKMVEAAKLKKGETVFDLGCGDGRLLFTAEKNKKVKAEGFEIAPLMYLMALLKKIFSRSGALIHFQSFFGANLHKADVIFCYLIPNVMPRLAEKILRECRPGTRIISNTFHIPDLEPSHVYKKDDGKGLPTIYVYRVK